MNSFHGFFYTGKNQSVHGLKVNDVIKKTMKGISKENFNITPYETYWKQLARYMIAHTAQGYLAWENNSYWIIGNCGRLIGKNKDKEEGVNIIRFTKEETIEYFWFAQFRDPDDLDDSDDWIEGPVHQLAYTPWNWLLEHEGDDVMFKLSKKQLEILSQNIDWTNKLHAKMEKKWPQDKYWK